MHTLGTAVASGDEQAHNGNHQHAHACDGPVYHVEVHLGHHPLLFVITLLADAIRAVVDIPNSTVVDVPCAAVTIRFAHLAGTDGGGAVSAVHVLLDVLLAGASSDTTEAHTARVPVLAHKVFVDIEGSTVVEVGVGSAFAITFTKLTVSGDFVAVKVGNGS